MKKLSNFYEFFLRPLTGRFFSATVVIFFLLSFSSCGKRDGNKAAVMADVGSNKYVLHRNDDSLSDEIRLKQAKYSDLPVPVGYNFVELIKMDSNLSANPENQQKDFFCYVGDLDVEQVVRFYRINMERLGWQTSDMSTTAEGLLLGKKSNKECAISVRNNGDVCTLFSKKNCICLFVKNKTHSEKKSGLPDLNSKQVSDL